MTLPDNLGVSLVTGMIIWFLGYLIRKVCWFFLRHFNIFHKEKMSELEKQTKIMESIRDLLIGKG